MKYFTLHYHNGDYFFPLSKRNDTDGVEHLYYLEREPFWQYSKTGSGEDVWTKEEIMDAKLNIDNDMNKKLIEYLFTGYIIDKNDGKK